MLSLPIDDTSTEVLSLKFAQEKTGEFFIDSLHDIEAIYSAVVSLILVSTQSTTKLNPVDFEDFSIFFSE